MPLSSGEIAQMTSSFSGMYNQQMGGSMMASMMGPRSPAQMGEQWAGKGMNMAGMVGGPMAMGAAALAGVDPFSLAMKAGMGVGGRFGVGMGLGAGAATLGVASAAYAAPAFAMNQGMAGAQQQQQLNSSLRANYTFQNGPNQQGFSMGQMGQIGNSMRSMTHDFGQGGEVTGMSELTRLASNMGKMGMSDNVRTVKQFTSKFKEMVTTLKTMATELGTSLEAAQELAASMRSSGIFNKVDQLRMTSGMKGFSAAGGVAMTELSSMSNIGSQISRSVGGRGRQGAFGGMLALGQIGAAQQSGFLSDEDIYNATGLTGAEGRQAMATSQMQQSAQFLKSGRGRYMLASMAGKDGQLDQDSVAKWMAGGMSTGETKGMANSNLGKVGRANFIRNEGKLRGAVLEQFGGLAMPMAYQQWLESRGHDPDNMNDRSMLAFQRFSGLGRDEAENAMKMVQNLPQMKRDMSETMRNQSYMDKLGQQRKSQGIEGISNRFDQAKEKVQGALQSVGQKVFQSGSEQLESFFNELMGSYEQHYSAEANKLFESAMSGSKSAQAKVAARYGIGGKGGASGLRGFEAMSLGGRGGSARETFNTGGSSSGNWWDVGNQASMLLKGESSGSRFERAGYKFSEGDLASADAFSKRRNDISNISSRARDKGKDGSYDKEVASILEGNKPLADALARINTSSDYADIQSLSGEARIDAMTKALQGGAGQVGDSSGLTAPLEGMSRADKARFFASAAAYRGGSELRDAEASKFDVPGMSGLQQGSFNTATERQKAFGRAFRGSEQTRSASGLETGAALAKGAFGLVTGDVFSLGSGAVEAYRGMRSVATDTENKEIGAWFEDNRDDVMTLFGDDAGASAAMDKKFAAEIEKTGKKSLGELTGADLAGREAMRGSRAALDYQKMKSQGMSDADIESALKSKHGSDMTLEKAVTSGRGIAGIADEQDLADVKQLAGKYGDRSKETLKGLSTSGVLDSDGVVSKDIASKLGEGGRAALESRIKSAKAFQEAAAMTSAGNTDVEAIKAKMREGYNANLSAQDQMGGMSDKELSSFADSVGGAVGAEARTTLGERKSTMANLRRGGVGGVLNKSLGLGLDAAGVKRLASKSGGALTDEIATALGVSADSIKGDATGLGDLLKKAQGGDTKALDAFNKQVNGIAGSDDVRDARRKRQEGEAKENDPSYRMLGEIKQAVGDGSKAVVAAIQNIPGATNAEDVAGGAPPGVKPR